MNGKQVALQAAQRTSERTAAKVHEQMKKAVASLGTIASTAPLIGFFGTVYGIPKSFLGCGGNAAICMAANVERLSWSIWTTALGLSVGLVALAGHGCFKSELERPSV